MGRALVRVEAKKFMGNASRQEQARQLVQLLRIFKRQCNEYGISHKFKEKEFFQRPCDVRRRKRLAAQMTARLGGQLPQEKRNG